MSNYIIVKDEVSFIEIEQDGVVFYAVIDTENLGLVRGISWNLSGQGYVRTTKMVSRKKTVTILLHRLLLGERATKCTDHINMNKLDCRMANLRPCTVSQNSMNRTRQENNTTGYKGVVYCKKKKKYRARIGFNRRKIHVGWFDCKEDAAIAYNEAARLIHQDFARLNSILGYQTTSEAT